MPVVRSLSNVVRAAGAISNDAVVVGTPSGQVESSSATINGSGVLLLNHDLDNTISNPFAIRRGRSTDVGLTNDNVRFDIDIQDGGGTFRDAFRLTAVMTDASSFKSRTEFTAFDTTNRLILSLIADGAAGLQLFGSTILRRVLTVSISQDVGSIAAGAIATFTIALPGVQLGDLVVVSSDVNLDDNLLPLGKVSAADVVTAQLHNTNTLASIDPPLANYRAIAIGV